MSPHRRKESKGVEPLEQGSILCMNCCQMLTKSDKQVTELSLHRNAATGKLNSVSIWDALTVIYQLPSSLSITWEPATLCTRCAHSLTQVYKSLLTFDKLSTPGSSISKVISAARNNAGFSGRETLTYSRDTTVQITAAAHLTSDPEEQSVHYMTSPYETTQAEEVTNIIVHPRIESYPISETNEDQIGESPTTSRAPKSKRRKTVITMIPQQSRNSKFTSFTSKRPGSPVFVPGRVEYSPSKVMVIKGISNLDEVNPSLTCPECSLSFPSHGSLMEHFSWVHKETELANSCKFCRKPCLSKRKLTEHINSEHQLSNII